MTSFVVQKHAATSLHYDFRLEMDGVLKSWAVPKGVPEDASKRLAIAVEDHSLEYGSFEGTIPEGQYGAGTVEIYDSGTYELVTRSPNRLVFDLHGTKCKGKYELLKIDAKKWLLYQALKP